MKPTKAQFRRFTRGYIRPLADSLGLRDWTIHVEWQSESDVTHGSYRRGAQCEPAYGRKWATITLFDLFFEHSLEIQRTTVIHELLHCHLAGMQDVMRVDVCNQLQAQVHEALYDGFIRHLELAVDGMAEAIAVIGKIPLPVYD